MNCTDNQHQSLILMCKSVLQPGETTVAMGQAAALRLAGKHRLMHKDKLDLPLDDAEDHICNYPEVF